MTDEATENAAEAEAPPETADVEAHDGEVGATADVESDHVPPDRAPSDYVGAEYALETMRRVDPAGAERLRREWGDDFDANLRRARGAAAAVADDALVAVLEETGLGNDPRILRAAARIGALLEAGRPPASKATGSRRHALEAELDRLVAGPDYWSHRVQRRVRQIFLSLHGDAPLPVHRATGDAGGMR